MRTLIAFRTVLLIVALFSSALCAASPPPGPARDTKPQPAADMERIKEEIRTRAVLKIERPEGICYWQIMGDSLLRMPVKESGFGTLLFSAQIVGDKLQVSVAGENQPLETTLIGRYSLAFKGEAREGIEKAAITADALRFGEREAWRLGIMPTHDFFALRTKGGIAGCCTCVNYEVVCCPSSGICMGCGTCGDCCGD